MFRGIIKNVYTPFSVGEWRLVGASERVKQKYEQHYERINLQDFMWSAFYQYFKYGQVFIYLMNDGRLITLPPHRCRIMNVLIDGDPLVEFNARSVTTDLKTQAGRSYKQWIEDGTLTERLKGYPTEVADAIAQNAEWVQLDPARCKVLQDVKEDWLRYAIPMVVPCLSSFAKKALIEEFEMTSVNMGAHSFLHVKYGDPKGDADLLPNRTELGQVNTLFKSAMAKSGGIATTNPWASAEFIQPDLDKLFDNDKFAEVNSEILSAGGISGIIVSGRADDGSSFASAQVSMQTAGLRIERARDNFCALMNKVNLQLNGGFLPHSSGGKIPKFTFPPVDLTGAGKLYETCYKLWTSGAISTQTMLATHGYDMEQEAERRKSEDASGITELMKPRQQNKEESADGTGKVGRPEMDTNERQSDPADSATGKQPKPSSPEGSM